MIRTFDEGPLPLSFSERAVQLSSKFNGDELAKAGADIAIIERLLKAVRTFEQKAKIFDAKRESMGARATETDRRALAIVKILNLSLASHDVESCTALYPHELTLGNVKAMNAALVALSSENRNLPQALKRLAEAGQTSIGLVLSEPAYRETLKFTDPQSQPLYFASLGKLPLSLDLLPEYRLIEAGEVEKAIEQLRVKLRGQLMELNRRLKGITVTLEKANALLDF